MIGTAAAGWALRFAHFGQPYFVRKYGGSAMWALMIYWVVSALMRSRRVWQTALVAGAVATAVEFLKLVHTPWLEAFRETLAGVILLGRYFSWWDVLAYWVAIGFGVLVDVWVVEADDCG